MSIESRSEQYGELFGGWRIEKMLGADANGKSAVFALYRDNGNRREYSALKVINLMEARQETMPPHQHSGYAAAVQAQRGNAERGLRLMDQIRGKANIVDCLDYKFFDWHHETGFGTDLLIQTELLTDLRSQMKAGKIFTEQEVVKIGQDICRALVICHGKNILHRGIKPENVFASPGGDYKLGDLGVFRPQTNVPLSQAGAGVGAAAYLAPEQFRGVYDHRVDIYSLGLVLYELINHNRLPFSTAGYVTRGEIQQRLSGAVLPEPDGGSKGLRCIIRKACAFDPRERYGSAAEMLQALLALSGQPVGSFATAAGKSPYTAEPGRGNGGPVNPQGNWPQQNPYGTQQARPGMPNPAVRNAPPVSTGYPAEKRQGGNKKVIFGVVGAVLAVVILAAVCVLLLLLRHEHAWEEASCASPRTCVECNETEGTTLAHTWVDATCTTPSTCAECGETKGAPLGHKWIEATYESPMTCQVCGKTSGEPLVREWIYLNELDYVSHDGKVWTMSNEKPDYYADPDITDSEAYKDENTPGHVTGPVYDYLGNLYTYGICVDGLDYAAYEITYYVGGEYETFSGTISMSPDVQWDSAADNGKYFEVICDGVVKYRSVTMTNTLSAQTFSVDITGVEYLTIRYPKTTGPSRMATIYDGKLTLD